MTSCEVMTRRTGWPTGTCSSLISRGAVRVLGLPHPLLGDDVDLERVLGRQPGREVLEAPHQNMNRKAKKVAETQPASNSCRSSLGIGPRFALVPRR